MLISISGSQGSGKTTILNQIKKLGYSVIERKTSRSILSEWNVTLDEVYGDRNLSEQFQDELLSRKQDDESEAVKDQNLHFTERSYADVFAYTLITNGWANKQSDWLNQYYLDCVEAQKKYAMVFYIKPHTNDLQIEDDGVRGVNKHYAKLVDDTILSTLQSMQINSQRFYETNYTLKIVEAQTVPERVRSILRCSHDLWVNETVPNEESIHQN